MVSNAEPLGSSQVVLKCFLGAKQAYLQSDLRVWMMGAFHGYLFVEMLTSDAGFFSKPLDPESDKWGLRHETANFSLGLSESWNFSKADTGRFGPCLNQQILCLSRPPTSREASPGFLCGHLSEAKEDGRHHPGLEFTSVICTLQMS